MNYLKSLILVNVAKIFDKKEKPIYSVHKLFKVVDFQEAQKLKIHNLLDLILNFCFERTSLCPSEYEINFGEKRWNSKATFLRSFVNLDQVEIVDLMCTYANSKSMIYFDNNILNYQRSVPRKSIVTIEIAIPIEHHDIESFYALLNEIYIDLQFSYGYVIYLTDEFDFGTERKIKKKLFGYKNSVEEIDSIWRFHGVGINHGFMKSVYPVNILNKAHIANESISSLIANEIGIIKPLNQELSIWSLNEDELNEVDSHLSKTKYVIANHVSPKLFMDCPEAKTFNKEMLPK